MIVMQESALNIGTTSVIAQAANPLRKLLIIQNKHATQTLRVAFGTPVVADVTQVQLITFSAVPDAGAWKVQWNGVDSGSLAFDIDAATLQTALRLLTGLSTITVAGDTTVGFTITMTGASPNVTANLALLVITNNTLTNTLVAVTTTVAITVPGVFANGYVIPAANGSLVLQGDTCPIDSINLLASGANTRAEILTG